MTRFVQISSEMLVANSTCADAFISAAHRQVIANGGEKLPVDFEKTTAEQRKTFKDNFITLLKNGFWEAYALETDKSPVAALLLVKEGYTPDHRRVIRFEDIVTQYGVAGRGYAKTALRAGGAMALQRYGNNIAITGEADEDVLKKHVGKIYRDVGGIQTWRQAARFNHDALVKFRASDIEPWATTEMLLNVKSASKNFQVELNAWTSAEAKELLEKISLELPVAYHVEIGYLGYKIAEAAKEDRTSVIRTATFDFDAPVVAERNESPIGSQIDFFTCYGDKHAAVDLFRVIGELVTAPQKSRTGGGLILQQSFCDIAVDIKNSQHQKIIDHFSLPYNNYATAEQLAAAGGGVSQIYWTDNPELPKGFVIPELVLR
jgi:hypothetical protein